MSDKNKNPILANKNIDPEDHFNSALLHNLKERVKELDCLYKVEKIITTTQGSLDKLISKIVEIIPSGWQYADVACAKITLNNQEFKSSNCQETKIKQEREIRAYNKSIGRICVYYLKELKDLGDRPFLEEEEALLDTLASRISLLYERKFAEDALVKSQIRYRDLVENANSVILEMDTSGKVIFWNKFAEKFFGYSKEEIMGRSVIGTIVPETETSGRNLELLIDDICKNPNNYSNNINENIKRDGQRIWIAWTNRPILSDDGTLVGVLCIGNDITERRLIEERLRDARAELEIRVKVRTAELTKANEELEKEIIRRESVEETLKAKEQMLERHNKVFLGLLKRSNIFSDDPDAVLKYIAEISSRTLNVERVGIWFYNKEHTKIYCKDIFERSKKRHMKGLELSVSEHPKYFKFLDEERTITADDAINDPKTKEFSDSYLKPLNITSMLDAPIRLAGSVVGIICHEHVGPKRQWLAEEQSFAGLMADLVSLILEAGERNKAERDYEELNRELIKANKKLKEISLIDQQTGLYNHRYLERVLEAELHRAKRHALPLSMIMLDIDYFNSVNELYGHKFGDLVLKQFSSRIKKIVRRYDIIIRFGGEEFIILSPGVDIEEAIQMGRRTIETINPINFGDKFYTVKLRLSISVVSYPENKIARPIDLIVLAEKILNRVKDTGGNKVYSYADITTKKTKSKEKNNGNLKDLKNQINKLNKSTRQSLIEAIFAFAKTIELKDRYTGEHTENTVRYATKISSILGLAKEETELIKQAAVLHDLGKIGISENILLKKSKLTKKEYQEIKKHPQIGADIIRPIRFLHDLVPLIFYHHERWDGKGYPSGIKADEIPLGARIIAIADVYQALTSDRPYRKAYCKREAISIIKSESGKQFDPKVVEAFLQVIKKTK